MPRHIYESSNVRKAGVWCTLGTHKFVNAHNHTPSCGREEPSFCVPTVKNWLLTGTAVKSKAVVSIYLWVAGEAVRGVKPVRTPSVSRSTRSSCKCQCRNGRDGLRGRALLSLHAWCTLCVVAWSVVLCALGLCAYVTIYCWRVDAMQYNAVHVCFKSQAQCAWFVLQLDRCAQRVSVHARVTRCEVEQMDGEVSKEPWFCAFDFHSCA